jgi:hypothetical protein
MELPEGIVTELAPADRLKLGVAVVETRLLMFGVPKPVARSNPAPAANPLNTPTSALFVAPVQLSDS